MPEIQRILVPINGTTESFKALHLACELATIYGAEIHLLLVTYFSAKTDDYAVNTSWLETPLTGSVSHFVDAIFQRAYDYFPQNHRTNLKVSTYHLSGQPALEILKFIHAHDIDLIIMGCRKMSFFSSILNGSTSRQLLEKADCPIIIAK